MKQITIGKSPDNDIVVNSPEVSRHHAVVRVIDTNTATIRDSGSTNGTYVNGNRITTEQTITPRDRVVLGKTIVDLSRVFNMVETVPPVPPVSPYNSTRSGTVASGAVEMPGADSKTIGRTNDNAIVMPQGEVSSKHAILTKDTMGNIVIRDQGSKNGTYVNGQKVVSATLRRGDKVLIAGKYPLDWERYMNSTGGKKTSGGAIAGISAGVVALFAVVLGFIFWFPNIRGEKKLTDQEIYDKYNSAVVMVVNRYAYKVEIEGVDDDVVKSILGQNIFEAGIAFGTGFFISDDGKIATNLHVARPWLYSNDGEKLAQEVRNFLTKGGAAAYITQVRVKGVSLMIGVLPNGLPFDEANLTTCQEYKGHEETEKDVAILQTMTHSLPNKVETFIDLENADLSDEALKPGNHVCLIGFPAGPSDVSMTKSDMTLHNQLQSGSITQIRDDITFGHNAASTHGASGSPMFNDKGRLIGVLNAGMEGTQGFNQGIKAKQLKNLML